MAGDCSIEELAYESQSGGKIVRLSDLQDWLTDKKVIKKGLNPHPYADVLHAVAEDVSVEVQIAYGEAQWTKPTGLYDAVFRIKPQEQVYECMYYDSEGKTDWLTEDEYQLMMDTEPVECYKALETKRIRK